MRSVSTSMLLWTVSPEEFAADGGATLPSPVDGDLSQLFYDVVLHDVRARRFLLEVVGADHVLQGSNDAGMDSVDGAALVNELDPPDKDRDRVVVGNSATLYSLPQR